MSGESPVPQNNEDLKLYVSSEDFNDNSNKYKSGQDIFLNLIIYNAGKEQQRILLPEHWPSLFGFFFTVSIEGSDSIVSPGGKVSLLSENYRYITLKFERDVWHENKFIRCFPRVKTRKI